MDSSAHTALVDSETVKEYRVAALLEIVTENVFQTWRMDSSSHTAPVDT